MPESCSIFSILSGVWDMASPRAVADNFSAVAQHTCLGLEGIKNENSAGSYFVNSLAEAPVKTLLLKFLTCLWMGILTCAAYDVSPLTWHDPELTLNSPSNISNVEV